MSSPGPHILGFRFSKLLKPHVKPEKLAERAATATDSTVPTKSAHFVISNVLPMGTALRAVLMQHMHRDAEDILNGKGGNGCYGTYNVAWYRCTCPSPLSDDSAGIMKTMFAENRYALFPHACASPRFHAACCSHTCVCSAGVLSYGSQAHIPTKSFCSSADFWRRGRWPALSASP
jgi:hypothetical protein